MKIFNILVARQAGADREYVSATLSEVDLILPASKGIERADTLRVLYTDDLGDSLGFGWSVPKGLYIE